MSTVVVGGTFDTMHKGHRALLDRAFEIGDQVHIALTTDAYIAAHKGGARPYAEREAAVRAYVEGLGKPFIIAPLHDAFGNATTSRDYQVIVVSPGSMANAERINEVRSRSRVWRHCRYRAYLTSWPGTSDPSVPLASPRARSMGRASCSGPSRSGWAPPTRSRWRRSVPSFRDSTTWSRWKRSRWIPA